MELKKNGQAERDQLKKELTTCREPRKHRDRLVRTVYNAHHSLRLPRHAEDDALKKIEALRASYDKQSRTLQNRLQKFGGS